MTFGARRDVRQLRPKVDASDVRTHGPNQKQRTSGGRNYTNSKAKNKLQQTLRAHIRETPPPPSKPIKNVTHEYRVTEHHEATEHKKRTQAHSTPVHHKNQRGTQHSNTQILHLNRRPHPSIQAASIISDRETHSAQHAASLDHTVG